MVTLPPEFVATKYPGYFFNTETKRLFSVKISGELSELRVTPPNKWNRYDACYRVSCKGNRRTMTLEYLNNLKPGTDSVVPVGVKNGVF